MCGGSLASPLTQAVAARRYNAAMPDKPETLSAEQLDAMTPDQRLQAFQERIVTDEDAIPPDFLERVRDRASDLGQQSVNKSG